jgi:hypothetical protein
MNAYSSGEKKKKAQPIASCDKSIADPTLVFFPLSLSLFQSCFPDAQ